MVGLKSVREEVDWESFSVKFEASRATRAFPFTAILNPPSLPTVLPNSYIDFHDSVYACVSVLDYTKGSEFFNVMSVWDTTVPAHSPIALQSRDII